MGGLGRGDVVAVWEEWLRVAGHGTLKAGNQAVQLLQRDGVHSVSAADVHSMLKSPVHYPETNLRKALKYYYTHSTPGRHICNFL